MTQVSIAGRKLARALQGAISNGRLTLRKGLPVLIVGAGFSGTLLAINLARNGSPAVLVERDGTQLAKGLAFGTRRPEHLLNVRASNMSAFPDDPEHFMRWMGFSTADQAARFVPRLGYGRYLRELLVEALSAPERLVDVVVQDAVGERAERDGVTVRLGDGKSLRGRALVLALGNFPPQAHPVLARLPPQVHWANPWQAGAMEALRADDHILLLGTGLTAVDVVLSLETAGYCGRITALSRRGLRPRSHAEADPDLAPAWHPEERGSRLVRAIRRRAAQVGWRVAIDELRPCTQHLWRRHDSAEQRRLLRHARPYWTFTATALPRLSPLESTPWQHRDGLTSGPASLPLLHGTGGRPRSVGGRAVARPCNRWA